MPATNLRIINIVIHHYQGQPQVVSADEGCGAYGQKCFWYVLQHHRLLYHHIRPQNSTSSFNPAQYTTLKMEGTGTSGTLTNLNFACEFPLSWVSLTNTSDVVPASPCMCRLHIRLAQNTASLKHTCPCAEGWGDSLPSNQDEVTASDVITRVET